jgi:hypothetical protein
MKVICCSKMSVDYQRTSDYIPEDRILHLSNIWSNSKHIYFLLQHQWFSPYCLEINPTCFGKILVTTSLYTINMILGIGQPVPSTLRQKALGCQWLHKCGKPLFLYLTHLSIPLKVNF